VIFITQVCFNVKFINALIKRIYLMIRSPLILLSIYYLYYYYQFHRMKPIYSA